MSYEQQLESEKNNMDDLTLEDITTSNDLIISEVEKNAYGAGAALKFFEQEKGNASFSVDYFLHLKVDVQKKSINGRFKLNQDCFETSSIKQYEQWVTAALQEEENRPDQLGKLLAQMQSESQKGLFPRREKFVFTSQSKVFILVRTCSKCNGQGTIQRVRYDYNRQWINGRWVETSRPVYYKDSCNECGQQGCHSSSAKVVTYAEPGIRARFPETIPQQVRNAISEQAGLYNLPNGIGQVNYQQQHRFDADKCAMLTYEAKCPFIQTKVGFDNETFDVFSYGLQLRLGHMDHLVENILKSELAQHQASIRKYNVLRSARPVKTLLNILMRSSVNRHIIAEPVTATQDAVAAKVSHAVSGGYVWAVRSTLKRSLIKIGQRHGMITSLIFLAIAIFTSLYQLKHHFFLIFVDQHLWKTLLILGGIPLLSTCITVGSFKASIEDHGGKQLETYASKIGVTKSLGWRHFWLMLILVFSVFFGLRKYMGPKDISDVSSQPIVMQPLDDRHQPHHRKTKHHWHKAHF